MSLSIWTIYENPKDYPGYFVARRWVCGKVYMPTDDVLKAKKLATLRGMLERVVPGLVRPIAPAGR